MSSVNSWLTRLNPWYLASEVSIRYMREPTLLPVTKPTDAELPDVEMPYVPE
jgi:hypothetical protein